MVREQSASEYWPYDGAMHTSLTTSSAHQNAPNSLTGFSSLMFISFHVFIIQVFRRAWFVVTVTATLLKARVLRIPVEREAKNSDDDGGGAVVWLCPSHAPGLVTRRMSLDGSTTITTKGV
ncbi:hypothetical protein E2C01_006916 [Portunus trituberculatus]|uniref:Uncharacterized protein n=1 Tax=Portunus trituberculatus TaxID=210409 RepID=A0A5B7CXR9_PORTR|nr:hypothetical protein [Portunus trituberculatus]